VSQKKGYPNFMGVPFGTKRPKGRWWWGVQISEGRIVGGFLADAHHYYNCVQHSDGRAVISKGQSFIVSW